MRPVAGIVVLLVFLNLSTLMYYLVLGVFLILFVSGGLGLSLANKHYVANLYLTLEGEAYQAKTVEPQGERVSVFSRAFLKTDWQPVGGTGEFPPVFTKRMEEDKLVLDLALSRLLPEFEWEKSPGASSRFRKIYSRLKLDLEKDRGISLDLSA